MLPWQHRYHHFPSFFHKPRIQNKQCQLLKKIFQLKLLKRLIRTNTFLNTSKVKKETIVFAIFYGNDIETVSDPVKQPGNSCFILYNSFLI